MTRIPKLALILYRDSYLVMIVDCGGGISSGTCRSLLIDEVTALWASLVAQLVKNLPAMWETWV